MMVVAGVAAAGLVIYFFGRKISTAASAAVDAVQNVNQGTPYEGYGALGTLGNLTNTISGGVFQRIGESLGESIFDIFHKPYDPNNPNTPLLRKAASYASPVRPEDARKISAQVP